MGPKSYAEIVILAALGDCGTVSGKLRTDAVAVASTEEAAASGLRAEPDDAFKEDYDPWEKYNEKMFAFNRQADRYVLKPAAKASRANTLNDRALNIDRFQGFEESVLDMYGAVRDAYLRRRELRIRE